MTHRDFGSDFAAVAGGSVFLLSQVFVRPDHPPISSSPG
jgi:hypothetical protein